MSKHKRPPAPPVTPPLPERPAGPIDPQQPAAPEGAPTPPSAPVEGEPIEPPAGVMTAPIEGEPAEPLTLAQQWAALDVDARRDALVALTTTVTPDQAERDELIRVGFELGIDRLAFVLSMDHGIELVSIQSGKVELQRPKPLLPPAAAPPAPPVALGAPDVAPTKGRIVWVQLEGQADEFPAIVTRVLDPSTIAADVFGWKPGARVPRAQYSPEPRPGSWRWPPRA